MTIVRQAIHSDQAPKAIGPYSQAIRVGDTVYMAGQIPLDPVTMQMVEGDFEKEARRVFENIKAVIAAAGGTFRAGREGHDLPDRLRQFRQGQRDHGEVLQGALPGALDGGGGGAAAQCARRNRVHAAPGLRLRYRGNARATRHAARATPGRVVARRRPGARGKTRETRRHAGAGPAVRAAVALRGPHADLRDRRRASRHARGGRRRNPAHRGRLSAPAPAAVPHHRRHRLAHAALLLFLRRAAGRPRARHAHALFRRSAARPARPRDRAPRIPAHRRRGRSRSRKCSRLSTRPPKACRRRGCVR